MDKSRYTACWMGVERHNLLYLLLKLAAGEHHRPATGKAADANVGARPGHFPFVSSARMWFSQTRPVADVYFERYVAQWSKPFQVDTNSWLLRHNVDCDG